MKLCQFDDYHRAGAVIGDQVYPLGDLLVSNGRLRNGYTMIDVIEALTTGNGKLADVLQTLSSHPARPLNSVTLLPPIDNPPSLWAAAANYAAHSQEMLAKKKAGSFDRSSLSKDERMAEFFLKATSSIVGPGGPVVIPGISKDVDFECELCAVIGKRARKVREEEALDYVFGYTICWDISQRDPWGRGRPDTRNIRKSFDTFTGLGPWIVTKDEIPDPQSLSITVEHNGTIAMSGHTSNMICTLRDHIRFLSGVLTLRPGDLVTTGTPAGVAKIVAGDHLKGSIEKIGNMEIDVRSET